jgi:4-hydroxybenzoate polyprenyltransferase
MNQIKGTLISFLKLVRSPNLIVVALTQYLLYFTLISPAFNQISLNGSFHQVDLFLFVLTTVCITAGGYILNDMIDVATDRINKPHTRIIEVQINFKTAEFLYGIITLLGAFIALYLAIERNEITYWFLYPTSVFLLFVYSKWLKGIPLLGNILISLFCGAVPGIFYLSENVGFEKLSRLDPTTFKRVMTILDAYILFAFLTNLFREIVKDLQDEAGDKQAKIRTAAVVWGIKNTKKIAFFVGFATSGSIFYTFTRPMLFNIPYLFFSQLLFIQAPLCYSLFVLGRAKKSGAFRKTGIWIKVIMILGLILILSIITRQNG